MSDHGRAIVEVIRAALAALAALASLSPDEEEEIIAALVADLRARRPVAVSPLGVLPSPTEVVRDLREGP